MPSVLEIDAARAVSDLRELAELGACGKGVERRALTPVDLESRRWLLARMRSAGLQARIDSVGNVIGRTPHARRIVIGSHTDTVPKGGWLDGSLGVLAGLEVARALAARGGSSPVGVEVISFSDEEGHFRPFLGSTVFCGGLSEPEAQALCNPSGVSVRKCLAAFSEPLIPATLLNPEQHLAFLELHIEQGPVLDAEGIELGIVTDIVGVRQDKVEFFGEANHAGTTPMRLRHDSAAALFSFATNWFRCCESLAGPDTVWNLGHGGLAPGAANVVSGHAFGMCQYRDADYERLDRISAALRSCSAEAAAASRTRASVTPMLAVRPTPMNVAIIEALERAALGVGASSRRMPSGAGHDAMIVGRHIPAGMLFVPSQGGISHSPQEDTTDAQLHRGIEVLGEVVGQLCSTTDWVGK